MGWGETGSLRMGRGAMGALRSFPSLCQDQGQCPQAPCGCTGPQPSPALHTHISWLLHWHLRPQNALGQRQLHALSHTHRICLSRPLSAKCLPGVAAPSPGAQPSTLQDSVLTDVPRCSSPRGCATTPLTPPPETQIRPRPWNQP